MNKAFWRKGVLAPKYASRKQGVNIGLYDRIGEENMFGNVDDALDHARTLLGMPPTPRPADAPAEVARERGAR